MTMEYMIGDGTKIRKYLQFTLHWFVRGKTTGIPSKHTITLDEMTYLTGKTGREFFHMTLAPPQGVH